MKNKVLLNKIFIFISIAVFIVLLTLIVLGNISRKGYLSEFQLNKRLSSQGNYSYNFRIKYYSKIFRNSDIYGVYTDTNKITQDNNFIKEIKFDEKGSPFGVLTSNKELQYDDKVNNIDYKLKIKVPILALFIILFIYLFIKIIIIKIKNISKLLLKFLNKIKFIFTKHKKQIIILYFALFILFILFIIISSNIKYTSKLTDLELIAESKAGYVYRAKVENYKESKLFSINNDSININNTNDIKYYGYSLEITNKPLGSWYGNTDIYYTDNNTFIISNYYTNNNGYYYNIEVPTYIDDIYKITLLAKNISENDIYMWHLNAKNNFEFILNKQISNNYILLTDVRKVKNKNSDPNTIYFNLIAPPGTTEIESILIESLNTNLHSDSGYIIFTSSQKKAYYNFIVHYNLLFNIKILISVIVIWLLFCFIYFKKYNYILSIVFIIPIITYIYYLIVGSINVPIYDDWELLVYYDKIKTSNMNIIELLSFLFSQHNEHRIFFPRLISIPILALTKWNVEIIMFISFFIYIIGCFIIVKYYINNFKDRYFIIILSIILFSLKQFNNITWAFQIAWFMIFTLSVLSFYFYYLYTKNNKNIYIIYTIIFGFIASFSSAQGLIIWLSFITLFILLILSKEINRIDKLSIVILILFGAICFILYFYNFKRPSGHQKLFSGNLINTFFAGISSSISNDNIFLGVILFLLSIFIVIYLINRKKIFDNAFLLLLLILSYGFIASITISRAWLGPIGSRYITFTNLLPISLFLLYLNNFYNLFYKLRFIILVLLIIIFLNNSIKILNNLDYECYIKKEAQFFLRNYKTTPLHGLKYIYPHGDKEYLSKNYFGLAEKYKFSVFNSKYDYLDNNFYKKGE
ncbi:hypothetical protein [Brachyspira pulli]|uniref:hypothetical protein n=1 Tax=Brachyspira pulli TaxID=310721 RepID=UPI0030056621